MKAIILLISICMFFASSVVFADYWDNGPAESTGKQWVIYDGLIDGQQDEGEINAYLDKYLSKEEAKKAHSVSFVPTSKAGAKLVIFHDKKGKQMWGDACCAGCLITCGK